jgi:hypothetical protein
MNLLAPTWTLVSSYPFRQPERVFFNPYNQSEIWVSSFGNGMKMGKLAPISNVPSFSSNVLSNLNCFPNPNKGHFFTTVYASENEQITLSIMDISARVLFQKAYQLKSGNNILEVESGLLSTGVYLLNVSSQSEQHCLKVEVE